LNLAAESWIFTIYYTIIKNKCLKTVEKRNHPLTEKY